MTTAVSRRPMPLRLSIDRRTVIRHAGLAVFVLALAWLVLTPLIRIQAMAFAGGDDDGYAAAFSRPGFAKTLTYTVSLAVGSLAIALVLGTTLAWAAGRLHRRLRFLAVLPILPIVVPAVASVSGWSFLLSPGPGYLNAVLRQLPWWSSDRTGPIDVNTLPWIVIITGFALTSFVYLFVRAAVVNISSEHLEAARVSGSSELGVFFRVTLPLLRPSLIYGGAVTLLLGLGQLTVPLLLGRNQGVTVLTTDIYSLIGSTPVQYGMTAAVASPLLIFGVVLIFIQKAVLGDQRRFVTHGRGFRASSRPSKTAAVAIIGYTVIAVLLPIIGLTIVALSRFWTANVNPSAFTLDNFRTIFQDSGTTDAIANSIGYSVLAVVIVLPLGFVAASVLVRGRRYPILGQLLDFIVTLPLGVPAVLFGIGFLVTYSRPPLVLYGTQWVMILVYVTLMLPFATRMQLSAMLSLGNSYQEASRVCGAGAMRTVLRIMLPLMRASLGSAAALIFVLLAHEFTASLFVRSTHTQVMGTVLYDYYGSGHFPEVAAVALVMGGVTIVGCSVALIIGGARSLSNL